jgi:hypothetical protein
VTEPLVFQHGAAQTAFIVATATWLVFEAVMRVLQRLRAKGPALLPVPDQRPARELGPEYEHFAAGRKRLVPGVW